MPVTIQTLGTIDLRNAEGRAVSAVLRQPKRLALLAYLAFARPAGFRRRDELLALLWPDYDEQRARAALRKTVHVLRAALGADVIQSRGDDELTIDFAVFHSDVHAFETALAEGRPRDAVELYRGEFLRGFHADASPAFERWLDGQRLRLRKRAAEAAAAVSESQQERGDLTDAVRWARRAVDLAPPDETLLRRLLLLLDEVGDRAGALEVFEAFAARLADEYDVDPAPETTALVAAIRARSQSHLTFVEPAPPGEAVAVPLPGLSPPRAVARSSLWKRALPVAVIAILGLTVAFVALRQRTDETLDPDRLAIAPFQVFDTTLAPWAVGVVEFVSRSLDQAGGLRMVPPSVAMRAWSGTVDLASASRFGRETGAGIVLLGSLLGRGGDSVRISATLVDAREGQPLGDIEIAGTRERVDVVVDSLAVEIVRALGAARRVVPLPHSRLSARSLPALKAFLAGEMALRRGAWDTAQSAFRDAVRLDSTFALAWVRLGITTLYIDVEGGPGWGYLLRALDSSGQLSRHDSMLVDVAAGIAAINSGTVPPDGAEARAAQVYRTALALTHDYPDDPESWHAVGSVRNVLFNLLPVTWSQVAEAYTRATVVDSTFVPAYSMALQYVLGQGDTLSGRRLAQKFLSLGLPDATRGLPLLIDRMLDPSVSYAGRERLLDSLPPEALFRGWIRLWLLPDSAERAIQVARASVRRPHDPRYWFTAPRILRRNLAASLAYRGHVREALAVAGTDDDGWFSNLLPDLARIGVVPPSVADSIMRDWVQRDPFGGPGLKWSYWWWAFRGDTASLSTVVRRSQSPRADLTAALALAQGDTAGAINDLQVWRPLYNDDPSGMIVLARLLAATGRERSALGALQREFFSNWPLTARVLWRLERARLAERLGRPALAREDYTFVAAVWREADPELAHYVAEAREGQRRLSGR